MERRYQITSAQFFVMTFVSRIVVTIGLNVNFLGGENMLEAIVSYVLAMALGVLLALPVWALHKRWPELSVGDAAQATFGKAGKAAAALYLFYFVGINGSALGLFQIFLADTVNPGFPAGLAIAGITAVAAYGALRGLETVARCAVCVFAFLLCGSALVFGIVAFRFNPENLSPLFTNGMTQTFQGTAVFLARTSVFAEMAVLLPLVKGRKKAGFLGWTLGAAAFIGILLLLMAGCLGPYAATQDFPVFSLSSLTEVRSLQRLDAIFVGVWMMGLVIKLASGLYACRVCAASLCEKKVSKTAVLSAGAAMLLLAYGIAEFLAVQRSLLNTGFWLGATVFIGAGIPLLIWLAGRWKGRKLV